MEIYTIPGLFATCFLIEQRKNLFLFDTGFLGFGRKVIEKIFKIGRQQRDLKLILVSHAHIDHYGGLHEVYKNTNALVGCHELEHEGTKHGSKEISMPVSKGGEFLSILADYSLPFIKTRGVTPHCNFEDGMSLEKFGLEGRVFHTPGHTNGSISLLLENGSAFTGDLIMGKTIVKPKPSLGAFANSLGDLYNSWIKILKSGAKKFYPAHGTPFNANELEEAIERDF